MGLGYAARQRKLLERALVAQERENGTEHREIAGMLASIGNAYGDLGDAAGQRDLLERASATQARECGTSRVGGGRTSVTRTGRSGMHRESETFWSGPCR